MFQPKPSVRLWGAGIGVILLLSFAAAANWSTIRNLNLFGTTSANSNSISPAPASVATVGSGGTYSTLKAAFDDINSGSAGLTGAVELDIVGDTSETAPAVLNASGTGGSSYTSVLIRPTGGAARAISGAAPVGAPLVDLNGADNVTVDGVNSAGDSLTISNTTASSLAGTSTVRFIGGAKSNKLTNSTVLGSFSGSATDGGTIFFSNDGVTGAGNDRNVISHNDLGPAGPNSPSRAIYSIGSTGTSVANNSGITIDGNNIHDYFAIAGASAGVYLGAGSTDIVIINNRFYQTTTQTQTTGAQHSAIWIDDPSGNNFKIIGNTIGYAASAGTGSYSIVTASSGSSFVPIYLNVGTAAATSVQANTIAGISVSGAGAGTGQSAPFRGIDVDSGLTVIGDAAGNTIGSQTSNDSITFTSSAAGASEVVAIASFGSADWITNNNLIGGISASNTGTGAASIYGMLSRMPATASWVAGNNTVGGASLGVIASNSTDAASKVQGIVSAGPAATLSYNIVRSLSAAGGTGSAAGASVAGIVVDAASANHILTGNSATDLSNSSASAATVVTGIEFNGSAGANVVERNLVARLGSSSTNTTAEVNGIRIDGGTSVFRNNMLLVGAGVSNAIGSGVAAGVSGIREVVGSNSFLHNSVYVSGSPTAGAGPSFALNSTSGTGTRTFRNNIFYNARTNSGTATGKNYAVRTAGSAPNPTGLTISDNIYFANGTGGTFGYYNGADVASLAAWKTAVGQDANSINVDPLFSSVTDLHLSSGSPARDAGATGTGVANDFDNKARPGGNAMVDMGADEFDGVAAAVNDMQATAFVQPVSGSSVIAGTSFEPVVSFTNAGSAAQTNVTVRYRICSDPTCSTPVYNQTAIIQSIAAHASGTFSFPSAAIASAGDYTIRATAELSGDTVPANDEINGTLVAEASLAGSYTIGSSGDYASIGAALDKLAAVGVTGPVTLSLTESSYGSGETFPIVIGPIAGASSSNRITIKPAAGTSPTIAGSSPSCLISLAGADYLTIDGSNNGTTSRDLTIQNTNSGTSSAVLCLQTAPGPDPATNDIVKNINISGSGNAQTLFGIFSGGAGVPSLTSLGSGNSSNTFDNNKIEAAQYGIYSQGFAANAKNSGNVFSRNDLNAAAPDNISKGGVLLGFENNAQVTANRIDGITQSGGIDVFGITLGLTDISASSWSGNEVTNSSVTGNLIGSIVNSGNFSAAGIAVASAGSGTNVVANNAIYGAGANGTGIKIGAAILAGGGAGSTTRIYFNSVSMTGVLAGGTGANYGLAIGGNDPAVDVRNNVFYDKLSNGTGVSFAIGTASSTFANLTSNHNDLYVTSGGGNFKIGKSGSLLQGTGSEYTLLGDWSTATGKDSVNSISVDPQFVSATNLHPQSVSPIIAAGTPIAGIATDISGTNRSATTPTIGAYESGIDTLGPTIQYTTLATTSSTSNRTLSVTVTDNSGVPASGTGLPHIYYRKGASGAFSASTQCSFVSGNNYDCTIDYSLLAGGTVATGDAIQYYVAAQDTTGNVAVEPAAGAGGFTPSPPAASTPPTTPNSYLIAANVAGALSVGTGQTFTSLTRNDAGGLFRYINSNVVAGDITIDITSDLTGEDGAIALNEFASPYKLTIMPSGGARIISGASTGSRALIKLNGADRVTINGSVDGTGTDRSLSISDSNPSGAVVWIAAASPTNPATDNIIEYCSISGGGGSDTFAGLLTGSGSTFANPAEAANDNNTFRSNSVIRVQNGVYINGKAAGGDANWLITGNVFGSSATIDKLGSRGVFAANTAQLKVQQNVVAGIGASSAPTTTASGVLISGLGSGGEVSRNQISDIKHLNATGGGSIGIYLLSSSANANFLVSNNFVWDIASQGTAGVTAADNGYGMMVGSGGGYRIYNNSVSLGTDQAAVDSVTAAINIAAAVPAGSLDVRNNAFSNSASVGTRYGIYVASTAGNAVFSAIDNNDYFAQNAGFLGSSRVTLADWQVASGHDAASISADPKFSSTADLHLLDTSPLIDAGTTIAAVPMDIDGDARPSLVAYDIGADEYLDHTAPDTTITAKPPDPSNSTTANFAFSGTDAGRSGVASFECKLDGGTFALCVSPLSYTNLSEGPHNFQVRAKDRAGNTDQSPAAYTWTIDSLPPDTTIVNKPSNPSNSSTATFTFTGSDTVITNAVTFECKLDADPFTVCTTPKIYNGLAEGEHIFQVRAVDAAQNADPSPAIYTWTVDTQPPDTHIDSNPSNPSNSASATFAFSGTDTVAANPLTFECRLDSGSFSACVSSKTYTGLAEGPHTFQVRAVDPAQNSDPSPASYDWTVDTQPPDTHIDSQPSNPSNSADATFKFSGADTVAGNIVTFECKLDADSFVACVSPKTYTALGEGSHTFQVRALDPAHNADASPAIYTWTIDTQPPDTHILTKPADPSSSSTAIFTFDGTDTVLGNAVTFECRLDGSTFAACVSPKNYPGLADGPHTFQVRAIDPASNADQSPASYTWTVDTQPPDTQILTKPADPTNITDATFTFSGADTIGTNTVTFECKLDTDAFAPCVSSKQYHALSDGPHTFQVRAVDQAGNVDATPATFTWTIDATPPDTQILTKPSDPSNSSSATFTFNGSDANAASGLTFQCKLDSGAFIACTSPATYSGLAEGPHTFQVRAIDWVGNVDASPAVFTWNIIYAVSVTATTGVLGPTKYLTLKAAFDAVNGGVHRGDVNIDLVGNTVETATATLFASGTGESQFNFVHIQPAGGGGRSIVGNIDGPLIDLNGADNLLVNGLKAGGNNLTISNTSGDPGASTVRLINDACLNIFLNTKFTGSSGAASNTGLGVIYFGPGIATGNDSNNFSGNTITATDSAQPINGIYSIGSGPGAENDGNGISNNVITDYFNPNGSSNGINLGANNSGWVISNNKMFQTAPRTFLTAAVHAGINITSGTGHSIQGNVIGYGTENATGVYTMNGAVATRFVGINLAVGTAQDTLVQSNTVAAINLTTSSGVSTGAGVLCGLNIASGNVQAGTFGSNTFGSLNSADSLVAISSAAQAAVVGINSNSTGTLTIMRNRFGGLTSANPSSPTIGGAVYGINISSPPTTATITGNFIGNVSADSMRAGVAGVTTADSIAVAINAALAIPGAANYSSNNIRNLSAYGTGPGGYVRGIQTGVTTNLGVTTTINSNVISNLTTNSSLPGMLTGNAGALGIQLAPGSNDTVTGNSISNISNIGTAAVATVVAGITHISAANTVISNNQIFGLSNSSTSNVATNPPVTAGILIRSGTAAINVQNNMVSLGAGPASSSVIVGIWAAHSSNPDPADKIYYNTVNIEGTASGGSMPTMAFARGDFVFQRATSVDLRNNLFNNVRSGGSGKHYAIANDYGISTGSSSTGWPATASNYNVLNANPATVGYWSSDLSFAGWKAVSGGDAVSFSGITVSFVDSSKNLHISPGSTPSALESGGTTISGLATDIDGQARPGPAGSVNGAGFAPDLGADEFDGVYLDAKPPILTYTALSNTTSTANRTLSISVADTTAVDAGANLPRIYYKKSSDPGYVSTPCSFASGTSQNGIYNCSVNYGLLPSGSGSFGDSIQYFVVAQDTGSNVISSPVIGFVGTGVNNVASPPAPPNSYLISTAYSGNVTVGAGGTFTSLTNPGGVFEALNNGVLSGNLTIKIVSDLLAETGEVSLNQLSEEGTGGYTLTIAPSGGNRTVSGSSNSWILRFADADRIVVEGSLSAGTANAVGGDQSLRNLTIQNVSETAVEGAVVAVSSVSNSVQNFTIRNVNLVGQDATQTQLGLHIGGANPGDNGGPNANIRVENCSFQKSLIGIYDGGLSDTSPSVGHVITMNDLSATGVSRLRRAGMLIFNQDNIQVTQNSIGGIVNDEAVDTYGIALGLQQFSSTAVVSGGITNSVVTRNRISGVVNINSSGFSAIGIGVAGAPSGTNVVSNNMISGVNGINTSPDLTAGVFVSGVPGSNTKLYYNSISMTGDRGSTQGQTGSYAVAITGTDPTVEMKNNILFTNQTSGGGTKAKSYALGMSSTTFTNLISNNNDFLSTGSSAAGFRIGGLGNSATDIATVPGWRSASGKDPNSLEADPIYMDQLNNLHLLTTSPMLKSGTAISGITTDFDGDTRPATPDIGADQVDQTPPETQIFSGPPAATTSTSATFTFGGTDSLVQVALTFQCQFDGGSFNSCTSPISYSNLAPGTHTFLVRAIDAVGNVDPTPAVYTWTIDLNPPDTLIQGNPANPSNSSSATFTFGGTDTLTNSVAGFECKLDTPTFTPCTSPQDYTGLADGSHTFQVRTRDAAENPDPTPAIYTWTIDTAPPDTVILTHPNDLTNSSTAGFTFSGTDQGVGMAGFECRLDTVPFGACTSPQNYDALADGPHTFQVRSKDLAGNSDASPASFTWNVDTTPPDTQIATHPDDPSASGNASFTFTGSDTGGGSIAGFECKRDTESFAPCTSPQNYNGLADGLHTFQVRAKDTAGNVDGTPAIFTWTIAAGLTGTFNIGAGGDFTSLTNPGGFFDRLNTSGVVGNVVANITSDLTSETGAVALNQLTGGFSLTIKPIGAARTISGNGSALGMIRLSGADNVTIDGSISAGVDKSLTLMYGNVAGAVIWIGSASATNGATGNTIKNCAISGITGTTIVGGIVAGSGTNLGGAADAANSNNTVRNNAIFRVQNSIYINGANSLDQNWNIAGNILGSTVSGDMNELRGILIGNAQNFTVNGNTISGIHSTTTSPAAVTGVLLTGLVNSGFVVNNTIRDVHNLSSSGTGAYGIRVKSTSPAADVTMANNFVSDVWAVGSVTLANNGFGIAIDGVGSGGYRIYHNTINLNTNQSSGTSSAFLVGNSVTTAGTLDVRNNIFANTQSSGAVRYAIYSDAAPNVFSTLGYNDYFAQNVGFTLGVGRLTLADWQGAAGMDSHSFAIDPRFVSPTDLHLKGTSRMINAAVFIPSITSDIDGQARPIGAANDIGADEKAGSVIMDFDGDGKSDESVFRPSNGTWYLNRSQAGFTGYQFGANGDYVTPADFTGDGKPDVAVFRPSNGTWFILRSEDNTFYGTQFGISEDIPAPGDYDGDGKADTAVFRPSTGTWFIQQSTAGFTAVAFGAHGDVPTVGDFDGDGKADVAVFRASNGVWYRLNSSDGSFYGAQFGQNGDKVVPADYTGDGKTDIAVWRPSDGTWYIQRSDDNSFYGVQFGATGDMPVPGDYDGDGKADTAVFRPSTGTWFEQRSTTGFAAVAFGVSGDKPAPNAYVY